jgi:TatD DNase family protein
MKGFIDAHNHLADKVFQDSRADIIAECFANGIDRLLVNSTSPLDWPEVLSLSRESELVVAHFGVHPWYSKNLPSDWHDTLESLLDQTPSAIGEIGLDGARSDVPDPIQEDVFCHQLAMARRRCIPVSIHGVRRWHRIAHLIKRDTPPACGFLVHAYNGDADNAHKLLNLGAYFSFSTLQGGAKLQSVLQALPPNRLLLETDSPYGASSTQTPNTPLTIINLYRNLSEHLKISEDKCADLLAANFNNLYSPIIGSR